MVNFRVPAHPGGEAAPALAGERRPAAVKASPMVAQYQGLKARHPDVLLFYRMGDFYELFFEDAVAAAPALEIALTRRGRHGEADIPMCGVPVHNAELYLHRLIRKGFKVAICEQLEDPAEARKRGGKALVRRDVVRIVTPGTLTEDGLLDTRRHNFLAAVALVHGQLGLAWVDISTGAFLTQAAASEELATALARLEPKELLLSDGVARLPGLAELAGTRTTTLTRLEETAFDSARGERRLAAAFALASLDAQGAFVRAELAAAGALFDYLDLTQKGLVPRLERPRRIEPATILQIDAATARNLELVRSVGGSREGSLLDCIDQTVTGPGARLLAERLAAPSTELTVVRTRQGMIESLTRDESRLSDVRSALRRCPDLERALSRLALGRGGPRDLVAIGEGLGRARALAAMLEGEPACAAVGRGLEPPAGLGEHLTRSLVDQPPPLARDGGFIRVGTSSALDEVRSLRDEGRRHILALEERYRAAHAIPSLKIRFNNLVGWFVEVTTAQRDKLPAGFVQRQSMAGATRFTTAELGELEGRLAAAAGEALRLEQELFDALRCRVLELGDGISKVARSLAEIDVAAALADLALSRRWVRPDVVEGDELQITAGRHPVVEAALAAGGEPFVTNDCRLDEGQRLWLLTGPNMAGKSTFLRQTALLVILAQMGSYVPAATMRLGTVDRLFSRVGAADDLARGRSTFMVEMIETAAILNQAGRRSLVILDEIGRGTATYDGLSLAWAVVEHLHEVNRCRALFATHYHELTALAAKLPGLACHTPRVKEWRGEVVFLHEIVPGKADRSYGIHVARLAGLPPAVVVRAEEVLRRLEAGEARAPTTRLADDLPLFAAAVEQVPASTAARSPLRELLETVEPDRLSPRGALDLVYRLKQLLADDETTL